MVDRSSLYQSVEVIENAVYGLRKKKRSLLVDRSRLFDGEDVNDYVGRVMVCPNGHRVWVPLCRKDVADDDAWLDYEDERRRRLHSESERRSRERERGESPRRPDGRVGKAPSAHADAKVLGSSGERSETDSQAGKGASSPLQP